MAMGTYDVPINGIIHTMQFDEEEADRLGLDATVTAEDAAAVAELEAATAAKLAADAAKQAEADNKAKEAQNKAASKPATK